MVRATSSIAFALFLFVVASPFLHGALIPFDGAEDTGAIIVPPPLSRCWTEELFVPRDNDEMAMSSKFCQQMAPAYHKAIVFFELGRCQMIDKKKNILIDEDEFDFEPCTTIMQGAFWFDVTVLHFLLLICIFCELIRQLLYSSNTPK
jgi:hypothetical protein